VRSAGDKDTEASRQEDQIQLLNCMENVRKSDQEVIMDTFSMLFINDFESNYNPVIDL
jgi:hypothetical protein